MSWWELVVYVFCSVGVWHLTTGFVLRVGSLCFGVGLGFIW